MLVLDWDHIIGPSNFLNEDVGVLGFTNGVRDTSKDISSFIMNAVLPTYDSSFRMDLVWDGESVLFFFHSALGSTPIDEIYGFTNGARDTNKDISTSVLNSAPPTQPPRSFTWDGESLLVNHEQSATTEFMASQMVYAMPAKT